MASASEGSVAFSIRMKNETKHTVKLLLSDQLRYHQKAVAEEKGSPNATKVNHIKPTDNI